MAAATFGNMVEAVVDTDRELIAVDAKLHSDLEAVLLEDGSKQKNIWVTIVAMTVAYLFIWLVWGK